MLKFLMIALIAFSTLVHAEEEKDYESIVAELKSSLKEEPSKPAKMPSDGTVEAGVGLVGSYVSLGGGNTPNESLFMKGFELHMAIELYSANWLAEGAFRSFSTEQATRDFAASLREFDTKIVYKNELRRNIYFRGGAGISARYLQMMDSRSGYSEGSDQTPAFIAMAGVERVLTSKVSIGPDVCYRTPLVKESAERGSVDAVVRINLHF